MADRAMTLFFSRLLLSPEARRSPEFWNAWSSPYRIHQEIWRVFRHDRSDTRKFLYRIVEPARRNASMSEPLLVGYALSHQAPLNGSSLLHAETKSFDPRLSPGDRLTFSLRLNPVVSREGKRHDLVMEAKLRLRKEGAPAHTWPREAELALVAARQWLEPRQGDHGFEVTFDRLLVERFAVECFKAPGKKGEIHFAICDLVGELTVVDVGRFLSTLESGLGHAKGFGCGMLLIQRAQSEPEA